MKRMIIINIIIIIILSTALVFTNAAVKRHLQAREKAISSLKELEEEFVLLKRENKLLKVLLKGDNKSLFRELNKQFDSFDDIALALAIAKKESSLRNVTVNNSIEHSIGYFQLNIKTVRGLENLYGLDETSVKSLEYSTCKQVYYFKLFLDYLRDKFPSDSLELLLKRYNAGEVNPHYSRKDYSEDIIRYFEDIKKVD